MFLKKHFNKECEGAIAPDYPTTTVVESSHSCLPMPNLPAYPRVLQIAETTGFGGSQIGNLNGANAYAVRDALNDGANNDMHAQQCVRADMIRHKVLAGRGRGGGGGSYATQHGHANERRALDTYARTYGMTIEDTKIWVKHPTLPIEGEIDAIFLSPEGERFVVDAKCPVVWENMPNDESEITEPYILQMQAYMMATGLKKAVLVFFWTGTREHARELRPFTILADEKMQKRIGRLVVKGWKRVEEARNEVLAKNAEAVEKYKNDLGAVIDRAERLQKMSDKLRAFARGE